MKPKTQRKLGLAMLLCFSAAACVGYFLVNTERDYEMMLAGQRLCGFSALGILVSLMMLVERPSATGGRCPCCGAPVSTGRHAVRKSGDAQRGVVRCPHCGAMLEP